MSGARSTWLIARRELIQRARSRAFQISTVIVLLVVVAAVVVPTVLSPEAKPKRIGLVGESPAMLPAVLTVAARSFDTKVRWVRYPDPPAAEDALRSNDIDVLLVSGEELVWRSEADPELSALLTTAAQAIYRQEKIAELGLTPEDATVLLAQPPLRSRTLEPVDPERGRREEAAMVGLLLLYLAILTYGSFVLYGVIEEKSSRVVEVLLSRVRPYQLLAGKVAGIGALGLSQLLLMALAAGATFLAVRGAELPSVGPGMVGSVLLWFLLGFALYSVIYAAMGALVSRQEDAQSVSLPMVVLVVAAYFAAFAAVENPSGLVARITSFVPPTAPLVMPVRSALSDLAAWEIPLAVALTGVSIYALVRLGGRVYAGAVLRIGPRVKLREAWRSG